MAAKLYQINAYTGTPDLSGYLLTDGWTLTEQAEEGSVGESTLTLYDTSASGPLATAVGQLQNWAMTDTGTGGDVFVWGGYSADFTWSRGDTVNSRVLEATVHDANYAWSRMVLTGTACKRPAETDVARVQWALSTYAADVAFNDVTTYVSTASPVNMDAADYRGQYLSDLMADCSQASGKNWWASQIGTGLGASAGPVTAWYGDSNTSTSYSGTCVITNDPDLIDLDVYWPPSQDARLVVDPSRIYSGLYGEYDGGATYRTNSVTATAYTKRDVVMSWMNVKTAAKAQARATRMLSSLDEPHERVTCTVRVPSSKVSQFKPGMRVVAKFTHLPTAYARWHRILRRSVKQVAAGTLYDIELEMTPQGSAQAYTSCPALKSYGSTPQSDLLGGLIYNPSGGVHNPPFAPGQLGYAYTPAGTPWATTFSGDNTSYGTPNNGSGWGITSGVIGVPADYTDNWTWDLGSLVNPCAAVIIDGWQYNDSNYAGGGFEWWTEIHGSTDGTAYTTIADRTAIAAGLVSSISGGTTTLVPLGTTAFRYVRLVWRYRDARSFAHFFNGIGYSVLALYGGV